MILVAFLQKNQINMKTTLLYLFLAITLITNAQNWTPVGGAQFSNDATSARLIFSSTGEPYIAYQDASDGDKTRVTYHDGTNWVDLGTVSSSGADSESINFNPEDNSVWVAHAQTSDRFVKMYRYNGTTWQSRSVEQRASGNRYNKHLGLYYFANGASSTMTCFVFRPLALPSVEIRAVSHLLFNNTSAGSQSRFNIGQNNSIAVDKFGNSLSNDLDASSFQSDILRQDNFLGSGTFTRFFQQQIMHYDLIDNFWIAQTLDTSNNRGFIFYDLFTPLTGPSIAPSGDGQFLSIDKTSSNDVYVTYAKSNNELTVQKYTNSAWAEMPAFPVISTNNTNFSQIAVNPVTDEVYLMYQDNGKITLLKYEEPLPPVITRFYVDTNATGNGSGDSWANAKTSLVTALSDANSDITEIWVKQGLYRRGNLVLHGFTVDVDGISIYGGFNGTETVLNERDVRVNETILSGDPTRDDSGVDYVSGGSRVENTTHVVFIDADDVTIDGVTIADGHANNLPIALEQIGAGVYINPLKTNFTLKNATVKNNVSFGGGNIYYRPATNGSITIENCIFSNNLARFSSSVYILTEPGVSLTALILNNLFYNNETKNRGPSFGVTGDLWIRAFGSGSSITTNVINNTFTNFASNSTNSGISLTHAPLVLTENDGTHTASVTNTIIYGNSTNTGAALYDISGGFSGAVANVVNVTNSIGEEGFSLVSATTNTLSSDPLFVDANNGNLRLGSGSPAIDAGDNSFLTTGNFSITNDLDFNLRIANTTVDIGAFEFGSTLSTNNFDSLSEVSVFPNPAYNTLHINTTQAIDRVIIYNNLGQKLMESTSKSISVEHLKNGLYFASIKLANGKQNTAKFIKRQVYCCYINQPELSLSSFTMRKGLLISIYIILKVFEMFGQFTIIGCYFSTF